MNDRVVIEAADKWQREADALSKLPLSSGSGGGTFGGMSELIDAKVAASEARTDAKFARVDARFDAVLSKLDTISDELRAVRDDNRNTRSTVRNSAFALAGVFLAIVGVMIAGAAFLPTAYSLGLSTREMIQSEVQKAIPQQAVE